MSKPNIDVVVEPLVNTKITYLPCAPRFAGGKETGRLLLTLRIHNNSAADIKAKFLRVSFPGSAVAASDVPVAAGSPAAALNFPASSTVEWGFSAPQDIVLPIPAPANIRLQLYCENFNDPWQQDYPLNAHANANPQKSYLFPASARDLRIGEYWTVGAASHGAGGYTGSQSFAYDFGVSAFENGWSETLKAVSAAQQTNANYRIWGKPILAMADGVVVSFANTVPTNPDPPTYDTNNYQTGITKVGSGNHFFIRHGEEEVQYAHMQPGSLNPDLLKPDAPVKAGQFLGLAGNAGNSSNPHLHFDSKADAVNTATGHTRPIVLRDCWVVGLDKSKTVDPTSAWVKLDHRGIPVQSGDAENNVGVAVWPYSNRPTWFPPEWAELTFHGVADGSYQDLFTKVSDSGYRLEWIDGYEVSGKAYFNVIFRPAQGIASHAFHGLGKDDYGAAFKLWAEDKKFRLTSLTSYSSGGLIRHAGVFTQTAGAPYAAFHARSEADYHTTRDDLLKKGFVPVNLSAVSTLGQRTWAGIFVQDDLGKTVLEPELTEAQYQTAYDENHKAGRGLAFLSAYNHSDGPRIVAIWHQKTPSPDAAAHGMTSSGYQAQHDNQAAAGRLTRAVAGYAKNGAAFYAAYWRK